MGGCSAEWVTHDDDGSGRLDDGVVVVVPRMYGDVRNVSNWRSL